MDIVVEEGSRADVFEEASCWHWEMSTVFGVCKGSTPEIGADASHIWYLKVCFLGDVSPTSVVVVSVVRTMSHNE